jgi:hypothetical protein
VRKRSGAEEGLSLTGYLTQNPVATEGCSHERFLRGHRIEVVQATRCYGSKENYLIHECSYVYKTNKNRTGTHKGREDCRAFGLVGTSGITFPTFALLIHKVDYFGASAPVEE